MESPVEREFTLGDFFYNWKETLTPQQVLDYKVDDTHGLKMYVDGEASNLFTHLVLTDEQSIVLDYYELAKGPNPIPENYEFEE